MANNNAAIPPEFVVDDLITSSYNIYQLLFYLNHKSHHDGVRDFLTNQLYSRTDEEIELILPQLCHLYQVWSPQSSGPLGDFFIQLCSQSIHFTIKIIWTFRAQQSHCPHASQRECMEKLIQSCEMSLINQSVFGSDGRMRKRERRKPPAVSVAHESTTLPQSSPRPRSKERSRESSPATVTVTRQLTNEADQGGIRFDSRRANTPEPKVTVVASPQPQVVSPPGEVFRPSPTTPAAVTQFTVENLSSGVHPINHLSSEATSDSTVTVAPVRTTDSLVNGVSSLQVNPSTSTPTPQAAATDSDTTQSNLTTTTTDSVSSCASTPSSLDSSQSLSPHDLFLLASCGVRAEYFHHILRLLEDFGRVSSALVKLPPPARNKKLRHCMKELDGQARGLYFPMFESSHRHYRILRLLPQETFILNSRDKAPFLFHFEIQYTKMSVYDPDLYLGLKSKDTIIKEALKLHHLRESPTSQSNSTPSQPTTTAATIDPELDGTNDPSNLLPSPSEPIPVPSSSSNVRVDIPLASSGRLTLSTSVPQEMDVLRLSRLSSSSTSSTSSANSSPRLAPMTTFRSNSAGPDAAEQSTTAAMNIHPHSTTASSGPSKPPFTRSGSGHTLSSSKHLPPDPILRSIPLLSPFETLSIQAFGESFTSRKTRVQQTSPYYRSMRRTDVTSLIYKHGDDCRQEVLAMQLIRFFHQVFTDAALPLYLHPYCVMLTSANSGLIETVKDAISIDSLKKNVLSTPNCGSLAAFFHYYFSLQGPEIHERAIKNFVESLAAYSVISYLLQIKDRHNGNLLLLASGHLVHIDFGFILSNSPGGNLNFEGAPFKLTQEFIEIMGGEEGEMFTYFKLLVIRGYLECRKHAYTILLLLEILSQQSQMACWSNNIEGTLAAMKDRFRLQLSEEECVEHAHRLVEESTNNWQSVQYDSYQRITNGIM